MCVHYYKSEKGHDTCQCRNISELIIKNIHKNNKCYEFTKRNKYSRISQYLA